VATVHRQSVPRIFWLEDVHLLSFSMLSDVTVFVYHSVHGKWYVYGDGACRGYICLLASGDHFDVLEGVWPDARPPVPRHADRQGLGTSGALAWHLVEADVNQYDFTCVHGWQDEEVELATSRPTAVSSPLYCTSYAGIAKSGTPVSGSCVLGSFPNSFVSQS